MANVISIRIDADGKAAIVETKRTTDEMSRELDRTGKSANTLSDNFSKIAIPAASVLSVYAIGTAVQAVTAASVKYLSTLETANLGIAASYITGGKYVDETTGKALEGSAALQMAQIDAARATERLQVANLQTIATLDQLIQAYQVALPIAMAKGFDRQKIEEFTVATVQAAGAIGVPMHQLGQELRALLTGDSWQDARIGQVLGLRPQDISKLKGDADGLFNLLMDKLSAYKIAGVEAQKSWAGLTSNALDIALQAGGQAFLPLFESVKYELTQITGELVTIDDKTKKINWNPDFLSGVDSVKSGVNSITAEIYRMSMLLDLAGGSMTALGSRALKTAEVVTRFMTIGQFGDSLKKGSEEFARWNKLYEDRYKTADKALQALADREAGLGKKAPSGSAAYQQKPPIVDPAAAEKARKAADKAAKNARDIEMILQTSAERILLIGKSADEKALLQMDLAHKKEVKTLQDHHASKAQLAQEEANYQLERTALVNEQKLEKARELARAESSIAEKAVADQIAWQQKLTDYQLKTGRIGEDEAITRKYEGEARLMQAKQATLEVQIEQEKNEARRLELEAEYWRLLQQITNLEETSGMDRSLAADALARSYEEINIRLLEMKGRLEDAAKARIALERQSPQRQQLAVDAATGVPGAEEAYLQQEEIDNRSIRNAGIQQQQPRNQLRNSMQMGIMQAQGQGYDASRVALLQQLDERQQAIEAAYGAEIELENEKNAALLEAQEEYAAQKAALDQATADKALATVSNSLTSIGQTLMQGNKDQFEAGKAMAIAGATIDTFRAATGAYAAMASIPYVGPALGAVAAAAAVVSGMAQIAQIESTQYRGARALGGPVEAGSTYLVGERGPELLTMGSQGGTVTPNSALGAKPQQVRVTNVYQISTGVSDTVRSEIMKAVPAITAHSVAAVGRAINSGGPLSAAVGRM